MSSTSSDEELAYTHEFSLPNKSRDRYLKAYEDFNKWRAEKGIKSFSESGLLVYFSQLSQTYKPSTLWSTYSMLKATINKKHDVKIEKYAKLSAFLKKQSLGYITQKAKVFSSQDIRTFLKNAPDEKFLATKVALIMGVCGALKSHELKSLKQEEITMARNVIEVTLKSNKKIVDQSSFHQKHRLFVINDNDFVKIVKKYIELRPTDFDGKHFFLGFRNGQCIRQIMGKNKLALVPREVATYLNLPDSELYTGHSLRRTGIFGDAAANITPITLDRCIQTTVAKGYSEESIENKTEINNKITESIEVEWHPEPSKWHEATHQEGNDDDQVVADKVALKKSKSHHKVTATATTSSSGAPEKAQQSQNLGNHVGFTCNSCYGAILGFRYSCVECVNFDLCARCEAMREHDHHYMLRVPGPRPQAEFTAVMADIRAALQRRAVSSECEVEIKHEPGSDDDIKPIDPLNVLIEHAEPYGSGLGQDVPNEPVRPAEDPQDTAAPSTVAGVQQVPMLAGPSTCDTMVARSNQPTMIINPLPMKTVRIETQNPAPSTGKVKAATEKRKSKSEQRATVPVPFKMPKQEQLDADSGGAAAGERAAGLRSASMEAEFRVFTMQNKRDDDEEFDSGVS